MTVTEKSQQATKTSFSSSKQLTLQQAEAKLLDSSFGYEASLRVRFQHPADIYAEDIHVEAKCTLERARGNPDRKKIATMVADKAVQMLASYFSAPNKQTAKLVLKLYVCDVSDGDREARIFASEAGVGHVRLCLAWILCFGDGSVVLDGGRVGDEDSLMHGVLDFLNLKTGESCLLNTLTPRLCKRIQHQINVASGKWFFENFVCLQHESATTEVQVPQ
jgi:hypothetical protein